MAKSTYFKQSVVIILDGKLIIVIIVGIYAKLRTGLWQKDSCSSGKKVEPATTFATMQCIVIWPMLHWPIKCLQAHILGRLLVFLFFIWQCHKIATTISAMITLKSCKILSYTINNSEWIWYL